MSNKTTTKTQSIKPIDLAIGVRENLTNKWLEELKTCPESGADGIIVAHWHKFNSFYFETIKEMGFIVTLNIRRNATEDKFGNQLTTYITRIEFI